MAQNRFKTYLKERQPFGDAVDLPFVNDAVTDPDLPDPKSWEELEGYIKRRNPDASDDMLNAARHVWQLYVVVFSFPTGLSRPEAEVLIRRSIADSGVSRAQDVAGAAVAGIGDQEDPKKDEYGEWMWPPVWLAGSGW